MISLGAGLRLLDPAKAEQLLYTIRKTFLSSGFLIRDNSVEIMDGTDEGIFSWFTVNFLLGMLKLNAILSDVFKWSVRLVFVYLGRLSTKNTVAALDLGGGSTQVTFVPKDPLQTPLLADHMHTVSTLKGKIDVFTHSYLNLGLNAARHAVFTNGYEKNQTNIQSICVNPIVHGKTLHYSNVKYTIR